jgi:putative membrane protein
MLLELIITLILGIFIGTLTGLFPGIHINLVGAILISLSAFLLSFTAPISLAVFIVALAITHSFVDFIPSIFLGVPNEDNNLSILPGHKLLLDGHGYVAIVLTVYGGILALVLFIFFIPLFIYILPIIYIYIQRIVWIILILTSLFMIFSEKKKNKILWAIFIFLLSGLLGIATLNLPVKEPLLPLFTGLFGASSIIVSLKDKIKLPVQNIYPIKKIRLSKSSIIKGSLSTMIGSPFTAFLPGMGSSEAAFIGTSVIEETDEKEFLFILGAINTLVMALSFITLYSINKTRTGASVAIARLMENFNSTDLFIIILAVIISGIIASIITIFLGKILSGHISRFNYTKISYFILFLLLVLTIVLSGILGLIILITSTSLGIVAINIGIKRTILMGSLIIPTILYYII